MKLPRDLSGSAQKRLAVSAIASFAAILAEIASHLKVDRDELLTRLFE